MSSLMITWTDIFEGTGKFSYWVFDGMKVIGQNVNLIICATIIFLLAYETMKIAQQNKKAKEDGTYK